MFDPGSLGAGALGAGVLGSVGNTYMQWQNLKYQKDLQKKIFRREDNSIQRRVADLKRAGLSPVLAAGQGASAGPAISTKPPQSDMAEKIMGAIMMKQNIAQSNAQIDLTKESLNTQKAQQTLLQKQATKAVKEALKLEQETRYAKHEADFYENKPFVKGMSNIGKMASEVDAVVNWMKDRLSGDQSLLDNTPKKTKKNNSNYSDFKQIR